jgi:hypothetical protein
MSAEALRCESAATPTNEKETTMVDATQTDLFPQELDHRASNGLEVSLLWSKRTNRLTVAVHDTATGEVLHVAARPDNALDVFKHPYAYAA